MLLRGGGSRRHDDLKVHAFLWLLGQKYEVVEFEIGGFDVYGLNVYKTEDRRLSRLMSGPVVIDAKTSYSDLVHHFRKEIVGDCDIDGKFSICGSEHYIIAKKGMVKSEAVHDPWGLLEWNGSTVSVVKECAVRAFVGRELFSDVAVRNTALMRDLIAFPKTAEKLGRKIPDTIKAMMRDENKAKAYIRDAAEALQRLSNAFEVFYGYNPRADSRWE